MFHTRKMGIKGQVVIPEEIRRKAGLRSGSEVQFDYVDGKIMIIPTDHNAFWSDFFSGPKIKLGKFDLDKLHDEELEERHNDLFRRKRVH